MVTEVPSQALEQQRVEGITFAAAVFTNLSPEHLDYHGDMERYFASKAKIFSQCRCAVINTADPYGRRLLDRANVPISGYHLPWQYRCYYMQLFPPSTHHPCNYSCHNFH